MAKRVTIRVIIDDINDEQTLEAIKKISEALADYERVTVELSAIR